VKKSLFILAFFILFKPLSPIVEYIVNYDYIIKVLCINKTKPELNCNGKCHLMKELAKVSEGDEPISDKKIVVKDVELLFFEDIKKIVFLKVLTGEDSIFNFNYCNLYNYLNSYSTFHPPTNIS
jgi:hypothetical protein